MLHAGVPVIHSLVGAIACKKTLFLKSTYIVFVIEFRYERRLLNKMHYKIISREKKLLHWDN